MKKIIAAVLCIAALAGGAIVIYNLNEGGVKTRATMVDYADLENTIELSGEITSKSVAGVSSMTGGMVKKLFVKEGQKVSAGDNIALLEDNGASELAASLEKQQAEAIEAMSGALAQKSVTLKDVALLAQLSSLELNSLNAALLAAKGSEAAPAVGLSPAYNEEIDALKKQAEGAYVKAGISGTVTALAIRVGESALPGAPIATVAQLDKLSVKCPISEKDISKVKKGMEVRLVSRQDGKAYSGKIASISPAAAAQSGVNALIPAQASGAACELTITPDEGFSGIVGLGVDVEIPYESKRAALCVPLSALTGDNCVYKLVDGRAVLTPVSTGMISNESAEIVSGLEWGDKILYIADGLADGVKVEAA